MIICNVLPMKYIGRYICQKLRYYWLVFRNFFFFFFCPQLTLLFQMFVFLENRFFLIWHDHQENTLLGCNLTKLQVIVFVCCIKYNLNLSMIWFNPFHPLPSLCWSLLFSILCPGPCLIVLPLHHCLNQITSKEK